MKKEFQMRIASVTETEFSIKNNAEFDTNKIGLSFETSFSKKEEDTLSVSLKISYVNTDSKDVMLSIGSQITFNILNLDEIAKFEDNKFQMPSELIETLLSITYSTTRGMLVCRTKDTVFSNHPLPLISPKELTKFL